MFQKVKFDPESVETTLLVLLCFGVFGISSFASGKLLYDYSQKENRIVKNVLAAESQKGESAVGAEEDILPEEEKVIEVMSGVSGLVKNQVGRVVMTRKISRQRAANKARILSGPVPTGPTTGIPDGRRVCAVKNDHPQGGGAIHVDEDCCPDPNETPNPRCYYSPGQLGILKGR